MKLLKRNLAFVLTLAMVLGLMVSASALNIKDYSDYNEITYLEAIDLLTSLGILEGTDGKFNPQDVLTREQGAKIIAYLMLGKEGAEALSTSVAPFKDVASGRWSAGFIAYCASQGIIGGYGNGNFGPTDTLTGNQFAKMLLVALGYGVNGEFTGPNWSIEVAKYALTEGIFDGNLGANFDAGTKREEAALYAFNALTGVMTVSYSETFGTYYSGKLFNSVDKFDEEYTLGYKLYNVKSKDTTDDFGREAHYWVKNSNTKLTETYHEEADAVYTANVKATKIYSDLGLTKSRTAKVITDGDVDHPTEFAVQKTDYKNGNIGGNGVLIEAYVDEDENVTLVKINTYLAQVTNVDDGTVTVSFVYGLASSKNVDNEFDTAVEYEEDDYVLVTIANNEIQSMVAAESKTGKVGTYADNYVKLGDEKLNKTDILKKNDSEEKDDYYAIDYESEMKVILDEYGYVIGIVVEEEADANYDYILVTGSEGRVNSLLSGKAAVVEVMHLDGKTEVLPLETKTVTDTTNGIPVKKTQYKLDTGKAGESVWHDIKGKDGDIVDLKLDGWYRYTMKDSGEIVLKADLKDKATGYMKASFTANGTQKLAVTYTGAANASKTDNYILNSKTVLHVVSEDSNKTYTGYKNIKKAVENGKILVVADGSLVSDIYVLDTDVTEDAIYAFYNGTTYNTTKGTWVTLFVDGEAQNYLLGDGVSAPVEGVYTIKVSDNELTEITAVTGAALTNRAKVTSAKEDYFQIGDGKHYYAEDVKVYDITDDGKAGTIARNDYVVFVQAQSGDNKDLVTYAYIVAAPASNEDPDTVVSSNGYTLSSDGKVVTITAPEGVTNVTYTVKAQILVDAENGGKEYVDAGSKESNGTYTVAETGTYALTITAHVVNGEKTTDVDLGTSGPYRLIATTNAQ